MCVRVPANATQDPRIVRNVVASLEDALGRRWLAGVLRATEEANARCISVFCSQGRHRSVSVAMVLAARYYPKAQLVHLTIR